jgi:uracil-DNA glycosylase
LTQLRARIVREIYLDGWREVWFFPQDNGVDGWHGTQDIMFVGLNPSTGRFGSPADRFFYAQLRRNGFRNAHLTDVIKERAQGRDVPKIERNPTRMRRYCRYLLAEIRIIRPRLVVGMGKQAYDLLVKCLGRHAVRHIPHYAPRFPTGGTRRRYRAKIAEIRRQYEQE